MSYNPCPICQSYEYIEWQNEYTMKDGTCVRASLECTECGVSVCGVNLEEVYEKWNSLNSINDTESRLGELCVRATVGHLSFMLGLHHETSDMYESVSLNNVTVHINPKNIVSRAIGE